MTREVPRERGRQVTAGVVWRPLFPADLLDRTPGAAPGINRLPALREADGRDRTNPVVPPLDVPGDDARIEGRIVHREEHLGVLIDGVVVALRDELCEQSPVPRRQLRRRAISP